jgi:hypothetical protein
LVSSAGTGTKEKIMDVTAANNEQVPDECVDCGGPLEGTNWFTVPTEEGPVSGHARCLGTAGYLD